MAIDEEDREVAPADETSRSPTPAKIKVVRMFAFVLVPLAFVGLLAFGLTRTAPPGRLVDKPAPDFSLPLLSGGQLSSDSLKGRPLVLNFWASWCVPCRQEAPLLEKKWQEYKDRGITVIGVNVQDSSEAAERFAGEHTLTFPIVRDVDLILYRKLGVRGLPETFFIDHTYKFTAVGSGPHIDQEGGTKVLGPLRPAVLEGQLRKLLEKQGREPAEQGPDPVAGHRQ